jgi:hypothetical protein
MAIPKFTGDEDKDEIDPGEWLRMIKKIEIFDDRIVLEG